MMAKTRDVLSNIMLQVSTDVSYLGKLFSVFTGLNGQIMSDCSSQT